jgi:hypothetical protein
MAHSLFINPDDSVYVLSHKDRSVRQEPHATAELGGSVV